MAVLGKVAGPMLKDNLLRNGTDLQIDTDLVYFDVVNRRVGINNTMPGNTLSVNGTFTASNVYVSNNTVLSFNSNLVLSALSGNINVSNLRIGNLATPVYNTDAATKAYVDTAINTSEPNLIISDGTRTDNVGINYETLTFFGNTSQMNVYVTNNQVTFGFVSTPTFYNNVNINGNAITNLVGLVLTNSQPYINSLGALIGLTIAGNLSVNAVAAGQIGNTNTILEGVIGSATPSQPNITSLGTLTSLTVTGNISSRAVSAFQVGNTNTILEGTIGTVSASQPNITSLGTLTSLTTSGTISASTINANTIGNVGSTFIGTNISLTSNSTIVANIANVNTIYTSNIQAGSANANISITPGNSGYVSINTTSAFQVPVGTATQYPVVNRAGMLRWNTDYGYLEVYTGATWEAVGLEGGTSIVTSDIFTGNGSASFGPLSQSLTTTGAIVTINGVLQLPSTAYSITANTITFTETPVSTDIIEVRGATSQKQLNFMQNGNANLGIQNVNGIDTLQFIDLNKIKFSIDTANVNVFNSFQLSGPIVSNVGNITVDTTTSQIDSFDPTIYRTAKYLISATNNTSNYYQSAEALVTHNSSTANIVTYGVIATNTQFFTLTANVYNGNVTLWATTTANTNFKVSNIYIPV